jgi:hypothetical protein
MRKDKHGLKSPYPFDFPSLQERTHYFSFPYNKKERTAFLPLQQEETHYFSFPYKK